ncbi:MAG: exopolysaccharide biosynthesis polyprenyl glycosylphosphotransferase [Clostridia bacterium]|nr:exopolysaccharide biosynthesis polyprenyl glycosylphosphotransferase [Clostridia bacterium]
MNKFINNLILKIIKISNPILLTVPFAIVWLCYYVNLMEHPFMYRGNTVVILLFFILYIVFGKVYDGFLISVSTISEIVYSQALAAIISDGILCVVIFLLTEGIANVIPMILLFFMQVFISSVWALVTHKWYFKKYKPQKTTVIFDLREEMEQLISDYGFDKKFRVQNSVDVSTCLEDLSILNGSECVFLSGVRSRERNVILKYCIAHDIRVYMLPRIGDVILSGAKKVHMFHLPMLRVERYNPSPAFLISKRVFDVVSSSIVILVLSPVMLITAIAIKATDKGPVLYKQVRLTKDGQEFEVLKFRSMRVDAEKDGVARLSAGDKDDRITPVGRIIRKIRVDELPQLFNILKGDMSVVGPRPERPEIAAKYCEVMPEFNLRLQAKAGLTGYAQVYGKYNTTPYDKLQMDLMYIAKPNFFEDLRIIFATIKILFIPESTEGVAVGQVTAETVNHSSEHMEPKENVAEQQSALLQ